MVKVYYNDKGVQLGNLLYLCLQVYRDRIRGEESYILKNGWYQQASLMFPNLAVFFGKANGRAVTPFPESYFQQHKKDFTSQELDDFCSEYLLPGLDERVSHISQKDLVICVRRGDMYSSEQKIRYGFDIVSYVNSALINQDVNQSVRVVSDDIDWCREHLKLGQFAEIEFCQTDRVDNFWQMVQTNRTLIIANSTFSYWAAYLLRLRNPNVKVIAPNFNTYLIDNGRQIADTRNWNLLDVTTELSRKTVGVFYVATGNYVRFFDQFYESGREKLLTDARVTYYIYTDNPSYFDKYMVNNDIKICQIEHRPFPYPTLYRYHFFYRNQEIWEEEDMMMFFNANTVFSDEVGVELLPSKGQLKAWSLPVYLNRPYDELPFEKREESQAFIPCDFGRDYRYCQGGFFCAEISLIKDLLIQMMLLVDKDQSVGITALWHDESYLNKLLNSNHFSYSLLPSTLYLPEEYGLDSKVMLLDKNKWGGHYKLRL